MREVRFAKGKVGASVSGSPLNGGRARPSHPMSPGPATPAWPSPRGRRAWATVTTPQNEQDPTALLIRPPMRFSRSPGLDGLPRFYQGRKGVDALPYCVVFRAPRSTAPQLKRRAPCRKKGFASAKAPNSGLATLSCPIAGSIGLRPTCLKPRAYSPPRSRYCRQASAASSG